MVIALLHWITEEAIFLQRGNGTLPSEAAVALNDAQ